MYKVYIQNDDDETKKVLYHAADDTLAIMDTSLKLTVGNAGKFTFSIPSSHPMFHRLKPYESEISVVRDKEELFFGRFIDAEHGFDNIYTIPCEGALNYLIDGMQRPFVFTGDIPEFIQFVLDGYNEQVTDKQKILLGTVTVTDNNGYMRRECESYLNSLEVLKTRLVDSYGGYFRIRRQEGILYLDYLKEYGGTNKQEIRFGENLLDLSRYKRGSEMINCLIPVGAEIEYINELGEKETKRVDITSVNAGKDYIIQEDAVAQYGRKVWGAVEFEDVTEPENLLKKSQEYLEQCSVFPETLQLSAVDLAGIDIKIEQFGLGKWTTAVSKPHGIRVAYILTSMNIDILGENNGSITLGKEESSLSQSSARAQKATQQKIEKTVVRLSSEMERKVENATALITGGLGGYVVLDDINPENGERMHPWRILIMNTSDKETATNVIQFNQNGIGFSTTGIDGPYTNAWTIDGNLVADFITTGTMRADRIKGGMLQLGGENDKNGVLQILDKEGNIIGTWSSKGIEVLGGIIKGASVITNNATITGGTFKVETSDGAYAMLKLTYTDKSGNTNVVHIGSTKLSVENSATGKFDIFGGMLYGYDANDNVTVMVDTKTGNVSCSTLLQKIGNSWKSGTTGNFTDKEGKTVTVEKGLITSIG